MLALAGWLPVWDLERRRCELASVLAWTRTQLARLGIDAALEDVLIQSFAHSGSCVPAIT